jgi:hypothetical protein
MSNFWTEIFRLQGTTIAASTPYHPESDGQAENTNRTMEQILRAYVEPRQTDWDLHLSGVEFAINDSRHASSLHSPFYIVYGHDLPSQMDLFLEGARENPERHTGADAYMENWRRVLSEVRVNLLKAQERQKEAYDKSRPTVEYHVGDKLLLKSKSITAPVHWGVPVKLRTPYCGPFSVTKVIFADDGLPAAYQLNLPTAWKCHNVFTVDKLKRYKTSDRWSSRVPRPPPPEVLVKGETEFVVDKILNHRDVKKKKGRRVIQERQYLTSWVGYDEDYHEWLTEEYLNNGIPLEQLLVYKKRNHLRVVQHRHGNDGLVQLTKYEDEELISYYIDQAGQLRSLQHEKRKLQFLVLFSGTGSVERAIAVKYPNATIISLDIDEKWKPTHCCDILDWVKPGEGSMYDYAPGYFDFIWASPPCTEYSRAKTVGTRDLQGADNRVNAMLQALRFLQPRYYVIENPQGLLHERRVMYSSLGDDWLPDMKQEVTYCMYGTTFKKPTHLWTNLMLARPLRKCTKLTPCPSRAEWGFHQMTAQSGPSRSGARGSGSAAVVYPIPEKLLKELLGSMEESPPMSPELICRLITLVPW